MRSSVSVTPLRTRRIPRAGPQAVGLGKGVHADEVRYLRGEPCAAHEVLPAHEGRVCLVHQEQAVRRDPANETHDLVFSMQLPWGCWVGDEDHPVPGTAFAAMSSGSIACPRCARA